MTETAMAAPSLLEVPKASTRRVRRRSRCCTASTSTSTAARSSSSSAPTAPARRRRCGRSADGRAPAGRSCSTGIDLPASRPPTSSARGVAHVPQGRGTLVDSSVEDNLRAGAYVRKDRARSTRTSSAGTRCSRGCAERRDQLGREPVRRRAADARRRPGADEPAAGCCCSTSRRSASRPLIVQDMFASSASSTRSEGIDDARSSSRTPTSRSTSPTGRTCSRPARPSVTGSADELRHDDAVRKRLPGVLMCESHPTTELTRRRHATSSPRRDGGRCSGASASSPPCSSLSRSARSTTAARSCSSSA